MSLLSQAKRTTTNFDRARQVFDPEVLRTICEMPERKFAKAYNMETVKVPQPLPHDFYAFRDNGSKILAVAHLDTVANANDRRCRMMETADGLVVYSRALDDRLGAYVILDMLPKLGISCDVLLTVGEESGHTTAAHFAPSKAYNWIIEFDRGGNDVVMYQYDDRATRGLVTDSGARVGEGSYSDIAWLDHLGVKAFNWGVGYQDYHGPRSHFFVDDMLSMVDKFMEFHAANADTWLPHDGHAEIDLDDDDCDIDDVQAWWMDRTQWR